MKRGGDVLFRVLEEIDFRSGVSFPTVDRAVERVLNREEKLELSDPFWAIAGTLLIAHVFCFLLEYLGAFNVGVVFLADVLILSVLCLVYRPLRRRADQRETLRRELLFTLNRHSVAAETRRRDRHEEDLSATLVAAHLRRRKELEEIGEAAEELGAEALEEHVKIIP